MHNRLGKFGIVAVLLIAMLISGCDFGDSSKTMKGLQLHSKNISSMTEEELRKIINDTVIKDQKTLTLIDVSGNKKEVPLVELGISINVDDNVKRIMKIGNSGSLLEDLKMKWESFFSPKKVTLEYIINEPQYAAFMKGYEASLASGGKNAELKVENGKVVLVPAVIGQRIDSKALADKIKTQLGQNSFEAIKIPVLEKTEPDIKDSDLKNFTTVLGSYTTYYDGSATNRANNINLAAIKVNQFILNPGASFSFNEVVGERTAEAGYDDAPVFLNGKLVPGIGGGICQVSSTLFAASLYAGMEILERTSHYAPVSYMDIGFDATVSYGTLDYVFRNPHSSPVYIYVENGGGSITIYFIGHEKDKIKHVAVEQTEVYGIPRQIIEKPNAGQEKDVIEEEGHDGTGATIVRTLTYADGRTVTDSFGSYYDPSPKIVIKGKPVVKPPDKEKKNMDSVKGQDATKKKKEEENSKNSNRESTQNTQGMLKDVKKVEGKAETGKDTEAALSAESEKDKPIR